MPKFPENIVVDTKALPRAAYAPDALIRVEAPDPMSGVSALANIPEPTDREDLIPSKQIRFNGQWLPNFDPSEIGPGNYQILDNCRYEDHHIEGVLGYSKLNMMTMFEVVNGDPVYYIADGISQLYVDDSESHILIHAYTPGNFGQIRRADVAGDFPEIVFTDSRAGASPRFSTGPLGSIVYSNGGVDPTQVWSGEEFITGAFIENRKDLLNPGEEFFSDFTERIRTDAIETRVYMDPDNSIYYIGSTRKLQGFTVYGSNDMDMQALSYFRGGVNWDFLPYTVTHISPEIHEVSFQYTDAAEPLFFRDYYLYWYWFRLNNTSTGYIDKITLNAPFQPMGDLWDGISRQPISFHVISETYDRDEDYTLQVNEQSSDEYPIGASIDSSTIGGAFGGEIIVGFEEPVTAIQFDFITDRTNQNDSRPAIDIDTAQGWMPVDWFAIDDQTLDNQPFGVTFYKNGAMSWSQESTRPVLKERYGVAGYWYRFTFSQPLANQIISNRLNVTFDEIYGSISHDGTSLYEDGVRVGDIVNISGTTNNDGPKTVVSIHPDGDVFYVAEPIQNESGVATVEFRVDRSIIIDTVTGVPIRGVPPKGTFSTQFDNRIFIAVDNRFEYSSPGAPDVWNGELSSKNGLNALYIGGDDPIMCATQLYNRFGSSIYGMLLTLKKHETYIIIGSNPEDFKVYPVSRNVGCPAPNTLIVAEMGYQIAEMANRNVAMWLAFTGPYIIDGAIISPIKGVENFFDKVRPECINFDFIHKAVGWYDQEHFEYNLSFPIGESEDNNEWIAYDLLKRKWFRKVPDGRSYPQSSGEFKTANGEKIIYVGTNNGHVLRTENGTVWDDTQEWNEWHNYPMGYTIWNRDDGMHYTALIGNENDRPPSANWAPGGPPGIEQVVKTGDFYPSGDFWDTTILRRIMIFAIQLQEDVVLNISHFPDTCPTQSVPAPAPPNDQPGPIASLPLAQGTGCRVLRLIQSCNHTGWCHSLLFRVTTSATLRGAKLLGYGTQAWVERMEE